MKKPHIIYAGILLIAILLCQNKVHSQSSSATNLVVPTNTPFAAGVDYLGWSFATNLPVNIKNENSQPINFYTSAGAATFLNLRMLIYDAPVTPFLNAGFVAIGNIGANQPKRQLDVYNNDFPQLRLTRAWGTNPANGKFTDFETTPSHDLNIRAFAIGLPYPNASTETGGTGGNALKGRVGINLPLNTEPLNTVEINTSVTDASGLRFSQMTSGSAVSNGSGKVLSVNPTGDVILVNDIGAGSLTVCSVPAPQINSVTKFIGTGPATICNSIICDDGTHVGIGLCSGWSGSKFEVLDNNNFAAPIWSSSSGNSSTAIAGVASGVKGTGVYALGYACGVYATANGIHPYGSTMLSGVSGIADGTLNVGGTGQAGNAGVVGSVPASEPNQSADNYGVYGIASASGGVQNKVVTNYGVLGVGQGGDVNIGVYGAASGGTTAWAGFFNGDFWIQGNGFVNNGVPIVSDARLKRGITSIHNAGEVLAQLRPVNYYFDTVQYDFMNFSSNKQYGLLAQDVEKILPDVVLNTILPALYDSKGNKTNEAMPVKALNYTELIPYLIAGYQLQDSKIQNLESQINDLQTQLNGCCESGMRPNDSNPDGSSSQKVELKSSQSNFLGQSVPNPNSSQCSIPYRIDPTVRTAEVVFSDQLGTELNRVEIIARGNGQLTVLSSQLEDGLYSYSLIVDGKLIDTKKMIKQH